MEQLDQVVVAYLKHKGYKHTEQAFKDESKTQDQGGTSQLQQNNIDSGFSNAIHFYNSVDSAPSRYQEGYSRLRFWVHSSLDPYRNELKQLLFPVFIHTLLELVARGDATEAKDFFSTFREEHESQQQQTLENLKGVKLPRDLQENYTARGLRGSKTPVRLSQFLDVPNGLDFWNPSLHCVAVDRHSYELLLEFLQGPGLMLMLSIINKHIEFQGFWKGSASEVLPLLSAERNQAGAGPSRTGEQDDEAEIQQRVSASQSDASVEPQTEGLQRAVLNTLSTATTERNESQEPLPLPQPAADQGGACTGSPFSNPGNVQKRSMAVLRRAGAEAARLNGRANGSQPARGDGSCGDENSRPAKRKRVAVEAAGNGTMELPHPLLAEAEPSPSGPAIQSALIQPMVIEPRAPQEGQQLGQAQSEPSNLGADSSAQRSSWPGPAGSGPSSHISQNPGDSLQLEHGDRVGGSRGTLELEDLTGKANLLSREMDGRNSSPLESRSMAGNVSRSSPPSGADVSIWSIAPLESMAPAEPLGWTEDEMTLQSELVAEPVAGKEKAREAREGSQGTGEALERSQEAGEAREGSQGTGEAREASQGTGEAREGSQGTGEAREASQGTGEAREASQGTGEAREGSQGTGEAREASQGTGEAREGSQGTGEAMEGIEIGSEAQKVRKEAFEAGAEAGEGTKNPPGAVEDGANTRNGSGGVADHFGAAGCDSGDPPELGAASVQDSGNLAEQEAVAGHGSGGPSGPGAEVKLDGGGSAESIELPASGNRGSGATDEPGPEVRHQSRGSGDPVAVAGDGMARPSEPVTKVKKKIGRPKGSKTVHGNRKNLPSEYELRSWSASLGPLDYRGTVDLWRGIEIAADGLPLSYEFTFMQPTQSELVLPKPRKPHPGELIPAHEWPLAWRQYNALGKIELPKNAKSQLSWCLIPNLKMVFAQYDPRFQYPIPRWALVCNGQLEHVDIRGLVLQFEPWDVRIHDLLKHYSIPTWFKELRTRWFQRFRDIRRNFKLKYGSRGVAAPPRSGPISHLGCREGAGAGGLGQREGPRASGEREGLSGSAEQDGPNGPEEQEGPQSFGEGGELEELGAEEEADDYGDEEEAPEWSEEAEDVEEEAEEGEESRLPSLEDQVAACLELAKSVAVTDSWQKGSRGLPAQWAAVLEQADSRGSDGLPKNYKLSRRQPKPEEPGFGEVPGPDVAAFIPVEKWPAEWLQECDQGRIRLPAGARSEMAWCIVANPGRYFEQYDPVRAQPKPRWAMVRGEKLVHVDVRGLLMQFAVWDVRIDKLMRHVSIPRWLKEQRKSWLKDVGAIRKAFLERYGKWGVTPKMRKPRLDPVTGEVLGLANWRGPCGIPGSHPHLAGLTKGPQPERVQPGKALSAGVQGIGETSLESLARADPAATGRGPDADSFPKPSILEEQPVGIVPAEGIQPQPTPMHLRETGAQSGPDTCLAQGRGEAQPEAVQGTVEAGQQGSAVDGPRRALQDQSGTGTCRPQPSQEPPPIPEVDRLEASGAASQVAHGTGEPGGTGVSGLAPPGEAGEAPSGGGHEAAAAPPPLPAGSSQSQAEGEAAESPGTGPISGLAPSGEATPAGEPVPMTATPLASLSTASPAEGGAPGTGMSTGLLTRPAALAYGQNPPGLASMGGGAPDAHPVASSAAMAAGHVGSGTAGITGAANPGQALPALAAMGGDLFKYLPPIAPRAGVVGGLGRHPAAPPGKGAMGFAGFAGLGGASQSSRDSLLLTWTVGEMNRRMDETNKAVEEMRKEVKDMKEGISSIFAQFAALQTHLGSLEELVAQLMLRGADGQVQSMASHFRQLQDIVQDVSQQAHRRFGGGQASGVHGGALEDAGGMRVEGQGAMETSPRSRVRKKRKSYNQN